MNGAREQFLTGPAFAQQENAGVRLGGALSRLDDALDLLAFPDDGGITVLHVGLEGGDLPLQRISLQRLLDDDQQVIFFQRLGQKVIRAMAHGFHRIRNGACGGHDDDGDVFALLVLGHAFQDVHAFEARQVQIQQNQIGRFLLDELKPSLAITGGQRLVSARIKTILQHRHDVLIVIDYEYLGFHRVLRVVPTLPSHS